MTSKKKGRIILATGGTGGHITPALAAAAAFEQGGQTTLITTDDRGARFIPKETPTPICRWTVTAPGTSWTSRAKAIRSLFFSTIKATVHFYRERPRAIISFGSYAALPSALAGILLRIPLIVHEQNAILGRTQKTIVRFSRACAISYPDTLGAPATSIWTGLPVKRSFASRAPYTSFGPKEPLSLLILGGSQGARSFAFILPDAISRLPHEISERLHISQQCRAEDLSSLSQRYAALPIPTPTLQPYFQNIPDLLTQAHLVISRSGASTMAEIAAIGRPALYLPFPHAAHNHQALNAQAALAIGAAEVLNEKTLTPMVLADHITTLLMAPHRLTRMAQAAQTLARLDAADRLVNLVLHHA